MAVKLTHLPLLYGDAGAREKFEELVVHLIRSERPDAERVRIVRGDGGIDAHVGSLLDPGGVDVFQVKYFPDGIGESQKGQIRESFNTIKDGTAFKAKSWTLCLPLDMSVDEKRWFDEWKGKQQPSGIEIRPVWGATKLEGLLYEPRNRGLKDEFFKSPVGGGEGRPSVLPDIRRFREERVSKVMGQDTPLLTGPGPWTVLHIVPFSSLAATSRVDLTVCERNKPAPLYGFDSVKRYNFDGLLLYQPGIPPDPCPTYLQLLHSGIVEAVEARMLGYHKNQNIPIAAWEREVIDKVGIYLGLQRDLGISPPLIVLLSLISVKGYRVPHGAFADTQAPSTARISSFQSFGWTIFPDLQQRSFARHSTPYGRLRGGPGARTTTDRADGWIGLESLRGRARLVRIGMRPAWLIESGVYGAEIDPLLAEIRRQGMTADLLPHRTLSKEKDIFVAGRPLADGDCVIAYGTFPFARQVQLHRRWVPGAWCDPANLDCTCYFAHFGKYLMNQPSEILPAAEAIRQRDRLYEEFGPDDEVFARPTGCKKVFTGRCIYKDDFASALSPATFDPDAQVVVAAPREIGREWRLVVVDDRVVAGCQYAVEGSKCVEPGCPAEVRPFAESMLAEVRWRPDPTFMVDVGESEGRLWLVELSGFSCSWLYACDVEAVVAAASESAERERERAGR